MRAMSDYLEIKVIDILFDADGNYNSAISALPSTFYIALFTTAINDAGGGGVEVVGSVGYARIAIGRGSSHWTRASNVVSNAAVKSFGIPSGDWGRIKGFGLYDHVSNSSNLLLHGTLTNFKNVNLGAPQPKFAIGELKFTLD